jgi:hypothetical protein
MSDSQNRDFVLFTEAVAKVPSERKAFLDPVCEDARASRAKTNAIYETKLPKLESSGLGGDWRDWIVARALINEARALLANPGVTGNEQIK